MGHNAGMDASPAVRPAPLQQPGRAERWLLVVALVAALAISGWIARDRLTWSLEVVWAIVGLALVAGNWKRFPLTRLLCWLLALHALVLHHAGLLAMPLLHLLFGVMVAIIGFVAIYGWAISLANARTLRRLEPR